MRERCGRHKCAADGESVVARRSGPARSQSSSLALALCSLLASLGRVHCVDGGAISVAVGGPSTVTCRARTAPADRDSAAAATTQLNDNDDTADHDAEATTAARGTVRCAGGRIHSASGSGRCAQ